jgi:HK97 family phage portal protein
MQLSSFLPAFLRYDPVKRYDAVVVNDGAQREQRSIASRGWDMLLSVLHVNKSGVNATQTTVLGLPAAFACIRQISETCAVLPVQLFQKTNSSERRYVNDHPSIPLLNFRPNDLTKAFDLRRDWVAYALIFPCSYIIIERDEFTARPIGLWLKPSSDVTEKLSDDGRIRAYAVTGMKDLVPEIDVLRLTNVFGKSVVTLLNEAFGTSLATQSFAAQYFANNGNVVRYAVTPNQTKNVTQKQGIESDLTAKFGPNSKEIPLMEHGIEIKELLGTSMTNSQALETRKWQAEDVCRIFNMPPSKIGIESGARYNSVEMTDTEFMKKTILPWITAIEQELRAKLLRNSEVATFYFRHKVEVYLRADIKTRMDSYKQMAMMGFTINEIRELEDYDPIEGGDSAFIQVNQIPLDKAQAYADKLISTGEQPGADNNTKV